MSQLIGLIFALLFLTVKGQYSEDEIKQEINAITRALETAKYPMHRQALENALTAVLRMYYDEDYDSILDDDDEKRSIATLAKNGQLPSREPDTELDSLGEEDENGHKRNIGSLARSGMMGRKRNLASVARQWQYTAGKRNIGSLMRNSMFSGGKRNIASIARTGYGKRNVGTLARDWALPKYTGAKFADDGKRNIQSMKNTIKGRKKRDIGNGALPDSLRYQTYPSEYDDDFAEEYPLEKRFLELIDTPTTTLQSFEKKKRHIGAIARSGWMPSFRPLTNRFSRSGRTETMERLVESSYLPGRVQPVPLVGLGSCRRCDQDQQVQRINHWGYNDNNLPSIMSLKALARTRSIGMTRSPRVAAASWRDRCRHYISAQFANLDNRKKAYPNDHNLESDFISKDEKEKYFATHKFGCASITDF